MFDHITLKLTKKSIKQDVYILHSQREERLHGTKEIIYILPMTVVMNITRLALFQNFNGSNNNKDEVLTTFTVYIPCIIESLIIRIQITMHYHSYTIYGHL